MYAQRRISGSSYVISRLELYFNRVAQPMMLNIGVLAVSRTSKLKRVQEVMKVVRKTKGGKTYINPTVKSRRIPIFLFGFICNFHRAFKGTTKMKKPLIVLKTPSVLSTMATSTQVPSSDLFHILALGVHSQILTKIVEM